MDDDKRVPLIGLEQGSVRRDMFSLHYRFSQTGKAYPSNVLVSVP